MKERSKIDIFAFMLIGHLAGDFLLQTSWMADNKVDSWAPLFIHSLIYTASVAIFAFFVEGLSLTALAVIFIGHIIIDKRSFVDFWAKHVNNLSGSSWIKIVQDQSWHIIILAAATFL